MKIQEASQDVTRGEIMFPDSKTSYTEANTQNDEETMIYALKRTHGRPEHDLCALRKP